MAYDALMGVLKLPKVQCMDDQISVQKIAFIGHPNCQISAINDRFLRLEIICDIVF
jgi:hypothetical protein